MALGKGVGEVAQFFLKKKGEGGRHCFCKGVYSPGQLHVKIYIWIVHVLPLPSCMTIQEDAIG